MKRSILFVRRVLALAVGCAGFAASAQTNSPGDALSFNAASTQTVTVANQSGLNAYPLTVMAWFKTSETGVAASLVNKYVSSSLNGYHIFLAASGHLQAWYFRDSGDNVYAGGPLDAGPVADGLWHHVAFTVDASGGRLYLDGVDVTNLPWSGTPGPTTTTQPLTFGFYAGATPPGYFSGQLDEVSIWNVALYPAQIQAYMNLSLAGTEANLVGYWRFDEGSGTTTADNSGNGLTGALNNGTSWVTSGANVGIPTPPPYTNHWLSANPPAGFGWSSIACSSDGSRVTVAGYSGSTPNIYASVNSGTNWYPTSAPNAFWFSVASSTYGDRLVASVGSSGGQVYTSTNSGTNWTPTVLPATPWNCVGISPDGSKLVAVPSGGGFVYTSLDSGTTWVTNNFSGSQIIHTLASSADGTKWVGTTDGYSIYISTDSGNTWNPSSSPNANWAAITCSADGSKLTAAAYGGKIYTSTDGGTTWNPTHAPVRNWHALAASQDGTKLVAGIVGGLVYTSADSGVTWTLSDAPGDYWYSAAASADGTRMYLADEEGLIYTALIPPSVGLAGSGGSLLLSWPWPSTGFSPWETPSVGAPSWSLLTTRPIVVNGQNQILLTPGAGHQFFELKHP